MSTSNLDSADLKAVARGGVIREDVMDRVWDISKIPLPFTDIIGTDTCKNEYKEWTTEELAAPNVANAVVDGADTTGSNNTVTGARVGNHCQISVKVVQVSTRANESDSIGAVGTLAHQVMKRQQELRRDVEAIALTGQASVADNGNATAGKAGGLASWLVTNVSRGATGANGGFNTGTGLTVLPTRGTARALSEKVVRDVVQSAYQNGGDPTVMMSVPSVIRKFSEYLFSSSARVATLMADQGRSSEAATALGSVKVFVSDFGTLELLDNRLQQTYKAADTTTDVADVFILDPAYLSLAFLHGYRVEPLAKTGLAEKRQMAVDWTLMVLAEKAQGVISDVDPTLAAIAA
jgi:hypothetical protein